MITRSGAKPRGHFLSLKNGGCYIPWESPLERRAYLRLEFSQEYVAYKDYQRPIEITNGRDGPFRTYPDIAGKTQQAESHLIEVKDARKAAEPHVAWRLHDATIQLADRGIPYLVWTQELLDRQPTLARLEALYYFRRPREQKRLITELVHRGFMAYQNELTIGDLAKELGGPLSIIRLMANDLLLFDIDHPPTRDGAAVLRLPPDS